MTAPAGDSTHLAPGAPLGPGFGATVAALSVAQILAWAALYYGFTSFVLPMTAELGSSEPAPAIEAFILNPPGILKTIADWITATAPKSQPELAVAAAIALCSTVMGRVSLLQFLR